jgi:hypothetical protein
MSYSIAFPPEKSVMDSRLLTRLKESICVVAGVGHWGTEGAALPRAADSPGKATIRHSQEVTSGIKETAIMVLYVGTQSKGRGGTQTFCLHKHLLPWLYPALRCPR